MEGSHSIFETVRYFTVDTPDAARRLMALIKERWNHSNGEWEEKGTGPDTMGNPPFPVHTYTLRVVARSWNHQLIQALEKNEPFWERCFASYNVFYGLYYFAIDEHPNNWPPLDSELHIFDETKGVDPVVLGYVDAVKDAAKNVMVAHGIKVDGDPTTQHAAYTIQRFGWHTMDERPGPMVPVVIKMVAEFERRSESAYVAGHWTGEAWIHTMARLPGFKGARLIAWAYIPYWPI